MHFTPNASDTPRSTLGRRLISAFLLVLLLGLIGTLVGLWSLNRINDATTEMVEHGMATERLVVMRTGRRRSILNAIRRWR